MDSKIEIISTENVEPSFPTPQNLKTYKLSMLDQIVPSMLVPIVLYFPHTLKIDDLQSHISHTTQTLKRSLSSILSRFYPLAGRVSPDGRSILCNDEGVPFVVARLRGSTLSEALQNPDPNLPRRLVPCEVTWTAEEGPDSTVALIQLNYFDCGGVAFGAVFWHGIADAMTVGNFISSWAATARGSTESVCPNYISQSLFPHKEELVRQSGSLAAIMKTGNSVMRRYVFDAAAVSSLKAESSVERPSRVEVVSALVWRCFMAASAANNKEFSVLTHAVNVRRRARPPFPSECFGNWPGLAAAASSNEADVDLGVLVGKMRESIGKIDDDFVSRLRGDGGLSGYHENLRQTWSDIPAGADSLAISSWCSFGFYDINFGWGKPVWMTRCDNGSDSKSQFLNTVWLMDTRNGDGIEAWVILDEKYMSVFHQIEELRALASIDPSPFDQK